MLIVRKNQLFDQEWQVCQYIKGEFVGVVSGMGRNAGRVIRRAHFTLRL